MTLQPIHKVSPIVAMAAAVIVIAGLKVAGSILIPFLLAAFIAVLTAPFVRWLHKYKVPEGVGVLLVLVFLLFLVLAVISFLGGTVNAFYKDLPLYETRFHSLTSHYIRLLNSYGFELSETNLRQYINPGQMVKTATTVLNSLRGMLTTTLLILLIIMFMLLEASGLPDKLRRAFGENTQVLAHFASISKSVQFYLMLKTIISLATGVLVWICLLWLDVPYASLWGMVAFLLNYIPTIGSIVAAIPAVIIALITVDPLTAGLVAVVYTVINTLLGSILEPRLMGNSLGISPLVVFGSLVFWGWLWGPIGMILCVPLTMVLKIIFETNPETHWLGILLGGKSTTP